MKIFTASQIKQWDVFTIENEPVTSVDLMERAAATFVNWFSNSFTNHSQPIWIFCGEGNNGGDGLAVARLLFFMQYDVSVVLCKISGKKSLDFQEQLHRLPPPLNLDRLFFDFGKNQPAPPPNAYIIDAIFGTGINRPLEGKAAQLIDFLNQLPNKIISIDLPSGMLADAKTEGICIEADYVFSFEVPKFAFFLPENTHRVGNWHIGSIGLHPDFARRTPTPFYYFTMEDAQKCLPPRPKFAHKGTFGHVLIVAGSRGMMGAAVLAGQAASRSGVGLVTMASPMCGMEICQIAVPSAMFQCNLGNETWTFLPNVSPKMTAIVVGPGSGQSNATADIFGIFLKKINIEYPNIALVLDADALNLLAQNPDFWHYLPQKTVLTPHFAEFERLFGRSDDDWNRLEKMRFEAQNRQVCIVLKGAHTLVALPNGNVFINSTGNAGMATAGAGDVLAGLLGGLLAQGLPLEQAVPLGVFLHGLAGDLAAKQLSMPAMNAKDLVDFLPMAWKVLEI